MFNLRPYQSTLLDDTRAAMARGEKHILTVAPTGSGKTVLFAEIARGAASKENRVLILVHRREILRQTMLKLWEMGVEAGQISADAPMTRGQYIQVAMVSTLVRRLQYVPRPDLIIVDEAHHAVAGQWLRVLSNWKDVPRLGFTATPERLDGRGLIDVFSHMIEGPSIRHLVKDGFLSYPVLYRPAEEQAMQLHVKRGDYDRGEQAAAMSARAIIGDVIDHYRQTMDGLPAVAFCPTVDHAHLVADQFTQAGYVAAPVWGNMNDSARDAAIAGLSSGSVQVITSCDVISEGVDVPVMAGAILLRRTLSLSLYLQQVGRALRPFPGKEKAVILDHVGNRYLHGHVLQDRDWSLTHDKRDPRKEKPPVTTDCPRCYAVWPGRPASCPSCGFDFRAANAEKDRAEFEVLRGRLVAEHPDADESLIEVAARAMKAETGIDKRKELWREAFRLTQAPNGKQRLDELRRMLGYKPAWTSIVWKEVQKKRGSGAA